MHETDMTKALIMTIKDCYESQPEKSPIEKVHLVVSNFTCVEPVSLKFAWILNQVKQQYEKLAIWHYYQHKYCCSLYLKTMAAL